MTSTLSLALRTAPRYLNLKTARIGTKGWTGTRWVVRSPEGQYLVVKPRHAAQAQAHGFEIV